MKWKRTHELTRIGAKAKLGDGGGGTEKKIEKNEDSSSGEEVVGTGAESSTDEDDEKVDGAAKMKKPTCVQSESMGDAVEEIDMVKTGCSTIATLAKALAAAEGDGSNTESLTFAVVVDKGGLGGAYVVAVWVLQQQRRLIREKKRLRIGLRVIWCRQHAQATATKEAVGTASEFIGALPSVTKLEKAIRSWIACNRMRVYNYIIIRNCYPLSEKILTSS
eukprot:g6457.t1